MLAEHPDRDRALGRLDDLQKQLQALDAALRRLVSSVRTPFAPGSLPDTLGEITAAFSARAGLVPHTELAGDFESLTDSQQIAILSVIREALSNVHRHSEAEHVAVTVAAGFDGVSVEVRDDGRGFDPEGARGRAAEAGQLGLVGMRGRIVMLGGRAEITSRPGGPTVVSATLPRWPAADR